MKGLRWACGSVVVGMLALLALPPFVPLEGRRAQLAEVATERFGEPVTIGQLTVSLLPTPHFTAKDVSFGGDGGVRVAEVAIRPRLTTLLEERPNVREVELAGVTASRGSLRYLTALLAPSDSKQQAMRVERVVLKNAVIKTTAGEIGPLAGDIAIAPDGRIARATVRTQDGKLVADVAPDGDAYGLTIEAKEWTLPWGPRLAFDSLHMRGIAKASEARFRHIEAKAYGGTVEGAVKVLWNGEVILSGELTLTRLELAPLLRAFSKKPRITGRMDAKPTFRIRTESADTLRLQGPFNVHAAVLHGVDLQAAASLAERGERKGETRFEELSGELAVHDKTYRYTNLKATSGALTARGDVALRPSKTLSGKIYAQLEALGSAAQIPLNISGTLDAPVIAPTAASIAGAAVGTAVLGPVLGASVGAKVGDIADKLLGRAEERK